MNALFFLDIPDRTPSPYGPLVIAAMLAAAALLVFSIVKVRAHKEKKREENLQKQKQDK